MMKQHTISLYGFSKTKFFSQLFIVIGIILLILSIIFTALSLFSNETGIIFAFSILFLGGSAILYFFHRQFHKLSQIAEELEREEDTGSPNG